MKKQLENNVEVECYTNNNVWIKIDFNNYNEDYFYAYIYPLAYMLGIYIQKNGSNYIYEENIKEIYYYKIWHNNCPFMIEISYNVNDAKTTIINPMYNLSPKKEELIKIIEEPLLLYEKIKNDVLYIPLIATLKNVIEKIMF